MKKVFEDYFNLYNIKNTHKIKTLTLIKQDFFKTGNDTSYSKIGFKHYKSLSENFKHHANSVKTKFKKYKHT